MTTTDSLLSFVPQVVRQRVLSGREPRLGVEYVDGVILASDVSGFTQLALSMRDTPDAIEELSTILNGSFASLIDVINEAGGDVLGFAGDALMAYWPSEPEAAVSAGWAALEAQRRLAEGDHRIRLRIGLGVGTIAMATVGGEGNRWFLTLGGAAPAEAVALQSRAELGQVAVSEAFVHRAGTANVTTDEDGVHRLVGIQGSPSRASNGAAYGGSLDESTLEALRPYVPVSVVDRLIAGHDHFLSEFRTVTVGLLATPGLEDPDRLDELQDVVAAVQRSTYAYGGVVDPGVDEKGVTFRIAFGIPPFAHEDDVDRALSAVRAIHRELTSRGVDHGIGVKTGQAFCGTLGNDVRREYALLSDIVSMAARLAGAAGDPSRPSVLCDDATAEGGRSRWNFDTPISLRLKSTSELYTAYGLLDRVARAGFGSDVILGRDREIEQVCTLVATPPSGPHGRLVVIEGEPGIGKSSLLGAVERALEGSGVTIRVGFADSLQRSAPFQAWAAVVAGLLDLGGATRADVADHLLQRVGPRAPLLSPVLAIDIPDTAATASLAGEQRATATQSLLLELLVADRDKTGSLVLLLEDAHWFDSASWSLLTEAVALQGIVVVITTRESPDTRRELARIGTGSETIPIHLEPLPTHDVRRLVEVSLGVAEIDDKVQAMVAETCKGNPFFVVELVQALAQRGALVVDLDTAMLVEEEVVHVPTTIQAAITSRVDNLSADEQLTMKVASVVGSTFEIDVLAEIHPTARSRGELSQDLRVLVDRDLIVASHDNDYEFNHVLTREVAYGLMTGDQRRGLHRSLATFHEASGDDLEYLYPTLAHHWLQAEDDDKAVSYLTLAAVSSLAHGMPRESVMQGVKAARVLGIELDVEPSKIVAVLPAELAEIDRLIAGRRPADLAALPELVDAEIGRGIGIVLQSMPSAHQSLQTELFALMAIRNLNLTLRFGAGPLAPGVYAMYSVVLRGLGADSALAYEFSELARTVDAPTHLLEPVVDFVHAWFNNHWFNPLLTGIPIAMAGAEAGLAGADHLFGSFNLAAATTLLATGGSHLDDVVETGERHLDRIGTWSDTASFHNRLEAQMAKALSGRTESLTSLTDEVADEQELAAMLETANFNQAAYYHIAKLRLAYLAGDPKAALESAALAYQLLPSFAGQVGQVELTVLAALAQLADLPGDAALRAETLDGVAEKLAELEAWSAGCPPNFAHKVSLVRGELAAALGESASADSGFQDAERQAAADGFPQWAALACERRGHAAASPASATQAFSAAAVHYRAWGASRKEAEMEALAAE